MGDMGIDALFDDVLFRFCTCFQKKSKKAKRSEQM